MPLASAAPMMLVVAPRNSVNTLNSERACASCGSSATVVASFVVFLASSPPAPCWRALQPASRVDTCCSTPVLTSLKRCRPLEVPPHPQLWIRPRAALCVAHSPSFVRLSQCRTPTLSLASKEAQGMLPGEREPGSKAADSNELAGKLESRDELMERRRPRSHRQVNVLYLASMSSSHAIHASKCFATFRCAASGAAQRFAAFYLSLGAHLGTAGSTLRNALSAAIIAIMTP